MFLLVLYQVTESTRRFVIIKLIKYLFHGIEKYLQSYQTLLTIYYVSLFHNTCRNRFLLKYYCAKKVFFGFAVFQISFGLALDIFP